MKLLHIAVLLSLGLAGSSSAEDNPIFMRMEAFKQAYDAKDPDAIAGFYTEDGALLPPQQRALIGRAPIAAHYKAAFDQGIGTLGYRVLELRQAGPDAAVMIGETQVKAGAQTILGRFLHVWRKSDGDWRIERDMYHVIGVAK